MALDTTKFSNVLTPNVTFDPTDPTGWELPPTGKVKLGFDDTLALGWIDDAGTFTPVGTGGGGGGITHSYVGHNAIGGSSEAMVHTKSYYKKVTLASDGFVASIGARIVQTVDEIQSLGVALLTDNSGVPGVLIATHSPSYVGGFFGEDFESAATPTYSPAKWFHRPLGVWVPAGDYWLAVLYVSSGGGSGLTINYDTGGSDYITSGGTGAPAFFDNGRFALSNSTKNFSIRADFLS